MLAGLRHDGLVRRDDEQRQVDAADSGKHVVHEPLVPRHVDDADLVAAGQPEPCEAQVDGHPAFLLLAETVRVDAGQCLNEGGLAVVNMTCRADNEHWRPQNPATCRMSVKPRISQCGVGLGLKITPEADSPRANRDHLCSGPPRADQAGVALPGST